jgi:DedD protein
MKFLLVLSDAFDALWAIRGRVALALGAVALLGVLVAIYLPMIPGGEPASRPSVAVHNPTAQGPVEPAKPPAQAAAPAPAPVAPSPAPAPAAAPTPQAAGATDPGSVQTHAPVPEATPAPEAAPVPEPEPTTAPVREPAPAPRAAPTPAAEPAFRVQVGAFREAQRARALSRRLTRAGFPTSVMPGTTPDGKAIYRVRTRQALPKGEARQLVARLRHRVPALRPILVPGGEAAG